MPLSVLIAKHPLARIIVTYNWVLILFSFLFFSIEVFHYHDIQRSVIMFSYYLLYLVVFGLTKHLFLDKIPTTFLVLRGTGALKESAVERLTHSPISRLEKPLGHSLGIVLSLLIIWFYRGEWKAIPGKDFWPAVLQTGVVIIDLLLAYAGGVTIWIVGVTAWQFRYLGRIGELNIRPFHPDRCAGLAPIGQLFFFSSLILIVIVVFFGGWLLYGKWDPDFDPAYANFKPWFVGSLLWVGLISIAVFFWPLVNIHRMMKAEAIAYRSKAIPFVAQVSDLEESLVASASSADYDALDTRLAQIESLRNACLHYYNIPTWPVDFQTRWQFLIAQLALGISLLTLLDKIKTFFSH